jgi:hypothetical protein
MKQSVNFNAFVDAFRQCGREDSFTYNGKQALFDYLKGYEADCDTEIELDVIALCCEYSEYSSALECVTECGYLPESEIEGDDDGEKEEFCLEYLRERTLVLEFTNTNQFSDLGSGIIIQDF